MSKNIIITEDQCKIFASLIKISAILMTKAGCHFKIGKTSDFENRPDGEYKKKYQSILKIYTGNDSDFVSELERILIKYYREYYPTLCDNKNEGEHEKNDDSFNCIYMVIE